uniref:Uncharacterized protein n=1 Tax=Arundo donax TaxID=35708 RepID=A0A0A9E5K6_ARUDO
MGHREIIEKILVQMGNKLVSLLISLSYLCWN